MEPLDLTLARPRSAHAELDGIAYLPRAIDKIRASFEGVRLGDYVVLGADGATMTGGFYRATGIRHDEFVQVVRAAPDDAAVGDWLHHRLDERTIAKWNEQFRGRTIGDITGALRHEAEASADDAWTVGCWRTEAFTRNHLKENTSSNRSAGAPHQRPQDSRKWPTYSAAASANPVR